MAAILIGDKKVVLPEYTDEYKSKYWSILTSHVLTEIGYDEITNPNDVTKLLKDCFSILCTEFSRVISAVPEAAFFLFCNNLHEDSIDLWQKQSEGYKLGIDEEQFAVSRRILKILLEQGCTLELKGHNNFVEEVNNKEDVYIKHLEELLYIGAWCIALSEDVSNSQLFPNSKGVQIQGEDLTILTYQPYPELFKFVHQDLFRHNSDIQLSNSIVEFKLLLKDEMGVDYDVLASFINSKYLHEYYNFSVTDLSPLIEGLNKEYGYDQDFLSDFYEGLTVSSRNVLSIEDCILKNQHNNRFIFRPILEYTIDDRQYNVVGYNKWAESLVVLTVNGFPFSHFPDEWKKHESIKKFVLKVASEHDSILEEPIREYLKSEGIKVDGNIKSFRTKSGNNISVEIEGVGEIDLLFLDEVHKILYVGECKHNRSRFDMNNWKRDYSNFVDKYEGQLTNKENWVKDNMTVVQDHFNLMYDSSIDFNGYIVKAAFFINAPTVYMHNGKYRAFTFTDLRNLIQGKVVDTIFRFTNEDTNETFDVGHPYFKNLKDILDNQ